MPKSKTRAGAKKRFRITASGKVKRATAYRSHMTSKSTKRKRKLRGTHYVATPDVKSVRGMLNI
ncbi:MAG: rpmI [Bacteroidetes bacterium]|nr:rpmI [Bacteroidota bacterium]